jgi:serine/threonine protein kinase/WD40 repeat protein
MSRASDEPGFDTSSDDLFEEAGSREDTDNPDASILGEFIRRWEEATDEQLRGALVEEYLDRYPHLEDTIGELVNVRQRIGPTTFVDSEDDPDPEHLGPYKVLRLLACGGMGKVYEATDGRLKRRLAVKTIRVDRAGVPRLLERFKSEGRVLARLHHTNIIPIYDSGEEDGLLYFTMPLIKGPSLDDVVVAMSRARMSADNKTTRTSNWSELIAEASTVSLRRRYISRLTQGRRKRPAPPAAEAPSEVPARTSLAHDHFHRVAEVVATVAEALHSAHEVGVVHFDIKPSNILIEPSGAPKLAAGCKPSSRTVRSWLREVFARVARRLTIRIPYGQRNDEPQSSVHPWVIDFGLANPVSAEGDEPGFGAATAGDGTRLKGTRGFRSPEMLMRSESPGPGASALPNTGPHTDVWSLGVTLYQLLTLSLPFASEQAVLDPEVRPRPPSEYSPRLPCELEAVVLKSLQKAHADRYATAAAFAADLRRWLDGRPTVAGKAGLLRRSRMWAKRRPAQAALVAAGVLLSLLISGATVYAAQARTAALRRELELLALQRLRQTPRQMEWFESAWERVRSLRGDNQSRDGVLQAQAAATLDGIDAQIVKEFDDAANMLAFDAAGERLLMGMITEGTRHQAVSRVSLGHLTDQPATTTTTVEGVGVIGFRRGHEPIILSLDADSQSSLHIRGAFAGAEERILRSPLNGPSNIVAHALSKDGSRAAAVVLPGRKLTPEGINAARSKGIEREDENDKGTIAMWDTSSGNLVGKLEAKHARDSNIVLSPDGALLASWDTSGRYHEVTIWSVLDRRNLRQCRTDRTVVTTVAFGPDPVWHDDDPKKSAWRLAVGMQGGMITVWDLHDGKIQSFCRGSHYDVKTLDFSPDGALLASGGRDDARLWDAATGNCVLVVPSSSYQFAVAFSPDGHRLAFGLGGGSRGKDGVQVLKLDQDRGMRTVLGLQQNVEKVVVSPDGRRIAALSNDWEILVFDRKVDRLIGILHAPVGYFTDNAGLGFNADGSRLVCSAGHEAKLWDLEERRLLGKWELPPALTEAPAFRKNGQPLLVRQETKRGQFPPFGDFHPKEHPRVCRLYELLVHDQAKRIAEIEDFDSGVLQTAITPDGRHFAIEGVGTETGKLARAIQVYEGTTGKQVGSLPTSIPPKDRWLCLRFDPKGTRLIAALDHNVPTDVSVFELPTLKLVGMVPDAGGSCINTGATRWVSGREATADSPDSLILKERRNSVTVALLRIALDTHGTPVQFSPDGNQLVWGSRNGSVTICDLNKVQRRLAGVRLGW